MSPCGQPERYTRRNERTIFPQLLRHCEISNTVAEVGLEPTRPYGQRILNPSRLPFRHSALGHATYSRLFEACSPAILSAPCEPCADWLRSPLMGRPMENRCLEQPSSV